MTLKIESRSSKTLNVSQTCNNYISHQVWWISIHLFKKYLIFSKKFNFCNLAFDFESGIKIPKYIINFLDCHISIAELVWWVSSQRVKRYINFSEISTYLTHHIHVLVDPSTIIYWMGPYVILGVPVFFVDFILFLMENHVSKQCRPWSDATSCAGDSSGSALFAYDPFTSFRVRMG